MPRKVEPDDPRGSFQPGIPRCYVPMIPCFYDSMILLLLSELMYIWKLFGFYGVAKKKKEVLPRGLIIIWTQFST